MNQIDTSKGFDLGSMHIAVKTGAEVDADLRARSKYGEIVLSRDCVNISTEYGEQHFHDTFVHELMEAINYAYCDDSLEHRDVANIATGFAQALKSMGYMFTQGKKEN